MTVPKPAMATRSTWWATSVAATVAVKPVPVEVGAEAAVGRPVDQLGRRPVLLGQVERGAGPVGEDDGDRETRLEHGPQDRPGTRDKDRETHAANLVGTLFRSGRPCRTLARICGRRSAPRRQLQFVGLADKVNAETVV